MQFAISSIVCILISQLAAGAAVPGGVAVPVVPVVPAGAAAPETHDIVFETIIHHDESEGTSDHQVFDIMSQKGDHSANADCQEYGHSCLPGQCCPGLSCITLVFGFGGWCW